MFNQIFVIFARFIKQKKGDFMKNKGLLIVFIGLFFVCNAQQQVSKTITHGGIERQYLEYVPMVYNENTAVPLLICLHGLGDNMANFSTIGMNFIADTANFIVLTPQAINSFMGTAWNSGASASGMQLNQNIDDVGFIGRLIDTTASLYNIDLKRVYVTGFSMGGFMCHRLACEYGHRIAAIASVAGTIGSALQCNPSRAIPVIHFHGTADQTVAYTGNQYGIDVDSLLNFWAIKNGCQSVPVHTLMPDNAADGFTVDHYAYFNQAVIAPVEHYKVNGADHQWIYSPVNDIDYSTLIWKFLSQFSNEQVGIEESHNYSVALSPNPASSFVNIDLNFEAGSVSVYSMDGKLMKTFLVNGKNISVDLSSYKNGLYLFRIFDREMNVRSSSMVTVVK